MNEVGVLPLRFCMTGMVVANDVSSGKNVIAHKSSEITTVMLDNFRKSDIEEVPVILTGKTQDVYDDFKMKKSLEQCISEYQLDYKLIKKELKRLFIKKIYTYEYISEITTLLLSNLITFDKDSVFCCIDGVRTIDEYLYTHSINVAMLACLFARWTNMTEDETIELVTAGLLHDIGKTKIDKNIIMKSSDIDAADARILKKHSLYSYEILNEIPGIQESVKIAAYCHHEKLNGSGYPRGLSGDQISRFTRILSICDIYDAMMANKTYRKRQSSFHVFDVFMSDKLNGNLDFDLVTLFLDKISGQFIGKSVLLDDRRKGKIIFMNPNDYARPLIQVKEEIIDTSAGNVKIIDIIN